jgi:hypothetical protein
MPDVQGFQPFYRNLNFLHLTIRAQMQLGAKFLTVQGGITQTHITTAKLKKVRFISTH